MIVVVILPLDSAFLCVLRDVATDLNAQLKFI